MGGGPAFCGEREFGGPLSGKNTTRRLHGGASRRGPTAGAAQVCLELRFVSCQTHDRRQLRLLTLINEYTRKCLAIRVARAINSFGVIEILADAMLTHGGPSSL